MQKSNRAAGRGRRARGDFFGHASKGARGLFAVALCAVLVTGGRPSWADDVGEEPSTARSSSSSLPSLAEAASYRNNDDDDWKFYAGLYGWFIFMNGAIEVQEQTAELDINFDNIWPQLHMAMFAEVEVQKGDFGAYTDLAWARLWQRQQQEVFNFKTDLDLVLLDFGLYWEALTLDLGSGPLPPRLRLQPYFGGRYLFLGTEIQVRTTPNDRVLTPASNSAAPVLGLRGFVDFDEHWNLLFAGDGGGFGVDGMDVTWLGELQGGYRFRFKSWDLNVLVGYKAVAVDISHAEEEVRGDLIFHGPVLRFGGEF